MYAASPVRHPHDCEYCIPLGEYLEYDLYACNVSTLARGYTLIARFGEAGDFLSLWASMVDERHHPALVEALRVARGRGLV